MQLKKYIFIFISCSISFMVFSQQQVEPKVNGVTIDYSACHNIKVVKQIPEVLGGFVCEVRDAQIIDDCLELSVVYGGCNGNLELLTDNLINKNSQLVFKAKWIEPSMCKSLTIIKVLFDLKPYKKLISENSATVKIANTNFELFYN